MNKFSLTMLAAVMLLAFPAAAQISIDRVQPRSERVDFADSIRTQQVERDAFSLAKYRAERAAIRKERNYLEITTSLQGTLTSFNEPWIDVSGGDNSIATIGSFYLNHIFKKEKFSINTKVSAKFGYNRMKVESTNEDGTTSSSGVWFKNQDEFWIETTPSFNFSKNWSYGAVLKFRSQLANGYKSRTEQEEIHRKSTFMSPGYLDISGGITYTCPAPKFPIKINLSPVALSAIFVESASIRHNFDYNFQTHEEANYSAAAPYGVPNGKTSKYEGGSSIQIDFDRKFGNKDVLRYRTSVFSFYGWITDIGQKNRYTDFDLYKQEHAQWSEQENKKADEEPVLALHPTVRWENTLDIKATKYLTTSIYFQLYYNRAQCYDVQTQTILSVGLSYTFQNKPKPK